MALTRPTLAALQSRTQTDITTRVTGAAPVLRRGILGPIINAIAGGLHTLYGFLQQRSKAATLSMANYTIDQAGHINTDHATF